MKSIQEAIDKMSQLDRIEFNQENSSISGDISTYMVIYTITLTSAIVLLSLGFYAISFILFLFGLFTCWYSVVSNKIKIKELLSKYLKVKIESKKR
jgi:hypothetical protein